MESKKVVQKYLNKYFGQQFFQENDNEFKSLLRILNKKDKPKSKLIAAAPEMFEFIASLENDDNSIPKSLWDKRNELLTKITTKLCKQ